MIILCVIWAPMACVLLWSCYRFGRTRGYVDGYISGNRVGRDEGWCECACDQILSNAERDRARRNRLGQFKGKGVES